MRMQRVSISMYECDKWHGKPLHLELLKICKKQGVSCATVIRGVAAYSKSMGISTSSLVEAGGHLPPVFEFVEDPERVEQLLPTVEPMTRGHLIPISDVDVLHVGEA